MFLIKLGQGSNIGVWVERGRQLVSEILRKRAAQTARARFPNANESKVQQQQANINRGILRSDVVKQDKSILARFTHQFHTQAAQLRRSAAMRMMAPSRRGNLVGFAFVGLALAHESQQEGDEDINLMPLDVCCEIIKNTFQKPGMIDDLEPSEFPSDLASYNLCPQLLGKGCNASIYAARVRESQQTSSFNPSPDDLDSFEVIPMETSAADSDTDNVTDDDSEASFIVLDAGECGSAGTGAELKSESEETFDLAVKMMFNYDVASNAFAISRAFEKEYLPLQQLPEAGMLQWQNGNHVKKKRKTLEPHANIIAMYHMFAAPVDVHDLNEARDMFPAALPKRMHADGFGRNMTMFIVMKRYDMTLTEYLQTVGCQSQHVAMVIVAQLLEGVAHLVANGVAHRDLKGNNILVNLDPADGSPHIVLADFGCCLADSDVNLVLPYPSREMCIGGNTALMAPEVKQTQPGPQAHINYSKTDTWAIGAIAYEVLGLRNPFYRHGNQSGLDSGTYQECDLPSLPDNTHPTLARVVRLLLRKDPSRRPTPQVAADMLHLSLWQPEWWKNACWESGQLLPTQRHITNWLLLVSMATLGSNASMDGCNWKLWQNAAELQLCKSWLSRVRDFELMQAVGSLHGIKQ